MNRRLTLAALAALVMAGAGRASDQPGIEQAAGGPPEGPALDFEQKLGSDLPLDLPFRDESNRLVTLRECFRGKPGVLVLAYYKCPHLCNQVLNGVLDVLRTADAPEGDPIFGTQRTLRREPPGSTQPVPRLKWHAGQEFTVVTVSFDPGEKSLLAGHKKQSYLTELKQDWTTAERGWRFLTGEKVAIERLADSVGFHYAFNAKTKQFDHPSGIVVVTPEGKVSRYFFGVDFPAERLQAALEGRSEEAGQKETSVVSLLCSMFSPAPGKYSSVVMAVVKTSSVLTAFGLAGFVAWLALRKPRVPAGEAGGTPGLPAAGTGG